MPLGLSEPSIMGSQKSALCDDIFWRVGRDYLGDPADVLALASTCRSLWAILEREIYVADVLDVKGRFNEWSSSNRCEPPVYDDGNGFNCDGGAAEDDDSSASGNHSGAHGAGGALSILSQGARAASRPKGLFPAESSAEWITELQEEHPQGGLHFLSLNGPVIPAEKIIAAARRFWPQYIDLKDAYGDAPIHLASRGGQLEIARRLLREGRCVARAASEYVCWYPRPLHEVINHLAERSSSNSSLAPGYDEGNAGRKGTLIHLSASRGGDNGLSECDYPFVTDALGLAILGGHADIAALLLEQPCYGEDFVGRSAKDGWLDNGGNPIVSPLHLAALAGMYSVVEVLLVRGADPKSRERCFYNCSPLHMASTREGTKDAIMILLRYGAHLSQLDNHGRTAAQWAESFGVNGPPRLFRSLSVKSLPS